MVVDGEQLTPHGVEVEQVTRGLQSPTNGPVHETWLPPGQFTVTAQPAERTGASGPVKPSDVTGQKPPAAGVAVGVPAVAIPLQSRKATARPRRILFMIVPPSNEDCSDIMP